MMVKVKYDHGHLYSVTIFGIYRICQTALPIVDSVLISCGVVAERLNPNVGIFRFLCFSTLLFPKLAIQNSKNAII